MTALVLAWLLTATPTAACDTVVVCPAEFRGALQPWVEHRTRQGHRLEFISNLQSANEIQVDIRRAATGGSLRFVVLVGDVEPGSDRDPLTRNRSVPVRLVPAKVNIHWGSEPEIATDNRFADLDGDRVPDVAIGRITADSAAELERIVQKILAYEQTLDVGMWRRRVSFVAGQSGLGPLADRVLETAARRLICDGVPPAYCTTMTYASWRSPYCPDPRQFRAAALARLDEGCLFWIYIGHGQRRFLDSVHVPGANYPILSCRDVPELQCRHGAAIVCFLACYAAAFDQPEDCLAEEMLRAPGGPVAVIGGSRVTMPYAMALLGTGMLDQCFRRNAATVGEALLAAKRELAKSDARGANRLLLDTLAALVSPTPDDLAAERAEHLDLFNLIGDPLLRLRYPQTVKIELPKQIAPGEFLDVTGDSPIDGACSVELVVVRDALAFEPPARGAYEPSSSMLAEFNETYRRANDPRLAHEQAVVSGGRFHARLSVPKTARGACHVRVFVQGTDDYAAGARGVEISPIK